MKTKKEAVIKEQVDDICRVIIKHPIQDYDRKYIRACFDIVWNVASLEGWQRGFHENRNGVDSGRQKNSATRLRGSSGTRIHTKRTVKAARPARLA